MRSSLFYLCIAAACAVPMLLAQQAALPVASRLSSLVLDALPAKVQESSVAAGENRLGSVMLAQANPALPNQSPQGMVPGQNPNTVRPMARPSLNPRRNPALNQPAGAPAGAPAGSPAPTMAPPATAAPVPPIPPSSSPVNAPPPAPSPPPQAMPPQAPAESGTGTDEEPIDMQYVNVPMPQILLLYEDLTGKKVIRDINVEAVTFTLETTGKLPKKEAIEFIERSLLLNGYGFVPAGEKFVKFINTAAMKPEAERPMIYTTDALPKDGEAIVTYIQPLQYLEAEDLKKSLADLIPLHAYGVISPLPNSRGIAITENSNTIRYIVEMLKHLDVEPSRTEKRTFQLTRSTAEDVAKALADILGLDNKSSGSGGGSSGGSKPTPPPVQNNPTGIPNQPGAAAAAAARAGVFSSAPQASATPPKLVPIARTNSLLVIARPTDLEYIATLIDELDAAATIRNFTSRPLKYVDASSIMEILGSALERLSDEGSGSGGSGGSKGGSGGVLGGANAANGSGNRTGDFGSKSGNGGFGSNGSSGFGSGFGGSSGSSGFGGGSSGGGGLQALRQSDTPQSLVVGKTLLIADPTQNEIFVSGPPEHMETVNMILDELDVRPRAVVLNVVIGSLTLKNDKDFGIDYIFRPTQVRYNKFDGTVAGSAGSRVGSNSTIVDPSTISALKDFGSPLTSGLQLFGTLNDQVAIAMSALDSNSDFKILSRPTIYTLNNQPASIQTGTKIPVPVSSLNSFNTGTTGTTDGGVSNGFVSNIQYQEVSLRLDVAPLIYSNEEIKLNIKQVNDTVAGSTKLNGNSIPNISTQGLETTILVKNKATVLLGGLISESTDKQRNGIPILRDLPLLKYVFSSTKDNKDRSELLIFMSPRIVTGEGDEPPGPNDSAGASPLGEDAQKFFSQERSDPMKSQKEVHRSKIGKLLQKLFQ